MAGAPPNGWIPPQPSSVQPAGLVWLDHGASTTWRAMSQPGQYAKPVAAGALPNGCRPPQPSSTYPPAPSGNSASPRAMFQLGQYAEALKTGEAASLWSPPQPSSVYRWAWSSNAPIPLSGAICGLPPAGSVQLKSAGRPPSPAPWKLTLTLAQPPLPIAPPV